MSLLLQASYIRIILEIATFIIYPCHRRETPPKAKSRFIGNICSSEYPYRKMVPHFT